MSSIPAPTAWHGSTFVPNAILFDPTLSGQAKTLYGILLNLSWQRGYAWASEATLGGYLGRCDRRVRPIIRELVVARLVQVERQPDGRTNHYIPLLVDV